MPLCECCGKEGADLRCGRCRASWYCSAACQKKHWKAGHRTKCVEADKPTKATCASTAPAPTAAAAAQSGGGVTAAATGDECAICLDALQQPQTLPCGHRFCRGCVAGMRQYCVSVAQVCPLCRGPMPDAARILLDASRLVVQYDRRWKKDERKGSAQPPWAPELLSRAAGLFREALAIDPEIASGHFGLGYALHELDDLDGANSAYRAAIAANPQQSITVNQANYNLGNLLRDRGDFTGAEAAFRAAIAVFPQDADGTTAWQTF